MGDIDCGFFFYGRECGDEGIGQECEESIVVYVVVFDFFGSVFVVDVVGWVGLVYVDLIFVYQGFDICDYGIVIIYYVVIFIDLDIVRV